MHSILDIFVAQRNEPNLTTLKHQAHRDQLIKRLAEIQGKTLKQVQQESLDKINPPPPPKVESEMKMVDAACSPIKIIHID